MMMHSQINLDNSLQFANKFELFSKIPVGVFKLHFNVIQLSLKLLLSAHGISSSLNFSVQASLHGFDSASMVFPVDKNILVEAKTIVHRLNPPVNAMTSVSEISKQLLSPAYQSS